MITILDAATPTPDVRFLDTISIGELIMFATAVIAVLAALRKAWPTLRRLVALGDALEQLPRMSAKLDHINAEVSPNDGGSIKDAIRRIEASGRGTAAGLARVEGRLDRHLDGDR